ncbi:hypothetical protein H6P81_000479 [Aristolochia fimbriata]|uniref:ATPase AAA-type core domain-containing protein n=1 Tax=Aristolochia fimbriata TaxID=158543 RepID=A0AAV7F812_ARIFI|nr:hypothetical protein H6P81_000479 [Aristolochia fimbriata]
MTKLNMAGRGPYVTIQSVLLPPTAKFLSENEERLKPQEDKNEEDRSKVDDLRGSPMSVDNLEELIDEDHAIVSSSVSLMKVEKAPLESYADIGGRDVQIQEIKEAVELPLTHPELYEDNGIKPPKGAVANSTSTAFLQVVGSELIQNFYCEIDAVGTKRYDAHSGGEREIQRTMLNQLDGFHSRADVKVILATNRFENLDPIHTSRMTLPDDVNLEESVMTKDEFLRQI